MGLVWKKANGARSRRPSIASCMRVEARSVDRKKTTLRATEMARMPTTCAKGREELAVKGAFTTEPGAQTTPHPTPP